MSTPRSEADAVSEQARFAAREFVTRFEREMGVEVERTTRDRMLLAFEVGFMQGHRNGVRSAMQMFDDAKKET